MRNGELSMRLRHMADLIDLLVAEQTEMTLLVAWLRECSDLHRANVNSRVNGVTHRHHADACDFIISAINSGEHLRAAQQRGKDHD